MTDVMERLRDDVRKCQNRLDRRYVMLKIADAEAVLDVADTARASLRYEDRLPDRVREVLCLAIGRLEGRDDHDWITVDESYLGDDGRMWQPRLCGVCGVLRECHVPTAADDLLERVLIAQLLPEEGEA
ncbi:MAG TPA: hypothetical protein DEU95_06210 [Chloroflexi bacterium]|jgi:hypothetical protein|nr:hypothetical protein [Chloroflexota bacterium]